MIHDRNLYKISGEACRRHGATLWKHLGNFYDTFKVTFSINSLHLDQPIKLFYKTKVIYVLFLKIYKISGEAYNMVWGDLLDTLQDF